MNELALFAGAGGGILGGLLCGFRTVCAVEINAYAASVLAQRQNDGILKPFPIWDDIRSFDGKPWNGIVDVVSGGFPCQDISEAGNGAGLDGERSGLWKEMLRIICEVRPPFAFVENSPMLIIRGLDRILGQLAEIGYNAEWGVAGCGSLGAAHDRERTWLLAWDSNRNNEHKIEEVFRGIRPIADPCRSGWGEAESGLDRSGHGVAFALDRNHAIGNGQVPAVVRKAWHVLCQRAAAGALRNKPKQHTAAANQNWRSRL